MKTSPELQKAVAEYQKGSVDAFNTVYEQSYKYLHTCVIHVVKNEDTAMDMLQETYLEISKSISQLKSTEDFLSWAAMIANRKCFAHLKKQKDILLDGSGLSEGDSDSADSVTDYFENIADSEEFIPETVLQDREKQRLIKEIIDGLNDMQRLCVIGFYYNEQKQEEIAEELGIPVNTVKSHLNRAKAKIKEAVVELDVKKGTRLYSFAPFMALLFREEVQACALRPMSKGLASAVGVSAGVGSGVLPGGLEAVKEFITENFGETLGEMFADTIGKAAIKVKALWAKFMAASIKTKAVVATTACAVTIGGAAAVMSPEKEVVEVPVVETVKEIRTADLDIVITEDGIYSELFDVNYNYYNTDERYTFDFHIYHDSETPGIHIEFLEFGNNKTEFVEQYKIDDTILYQVSFNDRPIDTRKFYINGSNDRWMSIEYNGCSRETFEQFVDCMFVENRNSEELFVFTKDELYIDEYGVGIDLEKVRENLGEILYEFKIRDRDFKFDQCISNEEQYKDIDEIHEEATNIGVEMDEKYFVNMSDYEWRCYDYGRNVMNGEIMQVATMNGTTWSIHFRSIPEEVDKYDWYAEYMKRFN